MTDDLFDPKKFGRKVSAKAENSGGIRAASRTAKVSSATMCRAAQGKNISVEVYFKLVLWLTGEKPWQ